jgi:hypothetical protein
MQAVASPVVEVSNRCTHAADPSEAAVGRAVAAISTSDAPRLSPIAVRRRAKRFLPRSMD